MKFRITNLLKIFSCLLLVVSMLMGTMLIHAEDPYMGYNYNYYGEAPSPNGYIPVSAFNGNEWGVGYFKNPADMYVDAEDNLYILDTGNGRIVKTDSELNVIKVIDNFTQDGIASPLKNPLGICVTPDGEIYICDTDNNRVVVTDQDGVIKRTYLKPVTDLVSADLVFRPKKIEVTATGDMYVLADNIVDGAMIIAENGEFGGFFATDAVNVTADVLKIMFYKTFMSEEQIKKMMSIQPVPFDNMYLQGDFLYTATVYLRDKDQIRKVNPAGKNLFSDNYYGEAYIGGVGGGGFEQASFTDVNVSEKGFFYALDKNFCKVFVYNQDNELLMIFGGDNKKLGHFINPVAIESIGDTILIMDGSKNNITVFEPTYYGEQIMLGSYMYEHGMYEKAIEPWYEVLKLNTNSELAYKGIARAEYLKGDYLEAMEHYRAAYDRDGYSEAREKYRGKFIMENFAWFMAAIIAIAAIFVIYGKNKKKLLAKIGYKTLAETGYAGMARWKYPFYNLLHPSVGMSEMRYNKKEFLPYALLSTFLWYASVVIMRQYEDYIFNNTNTNNINIFMILATTIGILLVGCIANWAITTLVEGKGTFKNIFIYASYALIPTTIANLIVTVLSQFMVQNEAVFVKTILIVAYAWTAMLMFMGMITVHQFTTKKAILMTLLTAVGMLVIVFLLMLLVVLYSQVSTFITTVSYELFYKFSI